MDITVDQLDILTWRFVVLGSLEPLSEAREEMEVPEQLSQVE